MGISIEQFRSRIGTYDNFLKTKDALFRFKDRYWNIMLMMFYLSLFYLPTLKQVVGQYKIWNEVMFWFTRMICYNVYIPLLMRQANDVEENPGPTIFDVINPMRTVSADYSQGNEALFGENAVPKLNPPADKSFDRLDDQMTANMDPCYKTGQSSIDSVDVPVMQSNMKL